MCLPNLYVIPNWNVNSEFHQGFETVKTLPFLWEP